MQISDLPQRVMAAKADWISASTWLGFTPTGNGGASRAQCQSTIQRQMSGGLVLEYITETAEKPNEGFEDDPRYLEEKTEHLKNRGRFLALHKLRHTSRSLDQILGADEFTRLQDMWAQGSKRWRWSVAFPIIETFEIIGRPNPRILHARTSLDVHHKFPLEEGIRYTSTDDFALLCPTCHRMEHQLLKRKGSFFDQARTFDLFSPGFRGLSSSNAT